MRLLVILCFFLTLNSVLAKIYTKSLTESMGQEVIEIGAPLKDLPGLEEEPSAENDDEDPTSVSIHPATKKESKKSTVGDSRRKLKDIDKIDGVNQQEMEEQRVEKELADIYKDNNDYNSDSNEASTIGRTNGTEKPDLRTRGRDAFKFQPDLNNAAEIERFRTSVDEISCDKTVTKKKLDSGNTDSATTSTVSMLLAVVCCMVSSSLFGN